MGSMGQHLRIATYNIHGWVDEGYDSNLDRVAQLVNSYDPDVLCLQEVINTCYLIAALNLNSQGVPMLGAALPLGVHKEDKV